MKRTFSFALTAESTKCARWSAQVFLPTSLYVSVRTIRLAVRPVTPSASSAGSLFAFFAFLRFFDAPGIQGARPRGRPCPPIRRHHNGETSRGQRIAAVSRVTS